MSGFIKTLDPQVRAAIVVDIQDGQLGRNAIARKHHVGLGTVTNIAQAEGLRDAFDRRQTARATADRQIDLAARRALFAENALDDADRIRDRFFESYTSAVSSREGVEQITLDEPDAGALRNFITAYAVLIDKHIALVKVDSDPGVSAVDKWLSGMLGITSDQAE